MLLSHWLKATLSAGLFVCAMPGAATAQGVLRFLDLQSGRFFTKAEIDASRDRSGACFCRSGDAGLTSRAGASMASTCRGWIFGVPTSRRRASIRANLAGANLGGVTLDQAWALDADLTGASLRGASLFATQLMGAKLDGADLSDARITGDLSRASMRQARLDRADLSADMRNQSMGLLRASCDQPSWMARASRMQIYRAPFSNLPRCAMRSSRAPTSTAASSVAPISWARMSPTPISRMPTSPRRGSSVCAAATRRATSTVSEISTAPSTTSSRSRDS